MVRVFRMCFQPLIRPVGFDRFLCRLIDTKYSTFRAASSVGKRPRRTAALRNLAFSDSIAFVV